MPNYSEVEFTEFNDKFVKINVGLNVRDAIASYYGANSATFMTPTSEELNNTGIWIVVDPNPKYNPERSCQLMAFFTDDKLRDVFKEKAREKNILFDDENINPGNYLSFYSSVDDLDSLCKNLIEIDLLDKSVQERAFNIAEQNKNKSNSMRVRRS